MGTLLLLIAAALSVSNLVQGHWVPVLAFWLVIGLAAYFRPEYPWGKSGPR